MDDLTRLAELAAAVIRPPSAISETAGVRSLVFDPPLSPAEQAQLDALVPVARSRIRLEAEDYATLLPEIEGLKTYHALASPTAAQTALATKAIIRILRAVFRD